MFLQVIALTSEECHALGSKPSRIELVINLQQGGLSPPLKLVEQALRVAKCPIRVMVRPHSESFVYSQKDIDLMRSQMIALRQLKQGSCCQMLEGVVLGMLDQNNCIHVEHLKVLLAQTGSLKVTFHKAFDFTDFSKSVPILNEFTQIDTVLTQGGTAQLCHNFDRIRWLTQNLKKKVLVGGGVSLENITYLKGIKGIQVHVGTAVRSAGQISLEKLDQFVQILNS